MRSRLPGRIRWHYLAAFTAVIAVFLAVDAAFSFRRERALAISHAVIDAKIVKAVASSPSRGGCSTRIWIEFQPPDGAQTYVYHEPWNVFSSSSSIDGWNPEDEGCRKTVARVGELYRVAYVPDRPYLNRPYFGELSVGAGDTAWKERSVGAMILAAFSLFGLVMWRKDRF